MKIVFNEIGCDWALVVSFDDPNPEAQQAMRETVAELNRIINEAHQVREAITIE